MQQAPAPDPPTPAGSSSLSAPEYAAEFAREVARVSAELDVIHRIDSGKWRCIDSADRSRLAALTRAKLAEVIVTIFYKIRAARLLLDKSNPKSIISLLVSERERCQGAAKKWSRHDAGRGSRLRHDARTATLILHAIEMSEDYRTFHPLKSFIPKQIDRLVLALAAVFAHTTDLTTNFVLDSGIASRLLAVASDCYPGMVRIRDEGTARSRYRRILNNDLNARDLAADDFFLFRLAMFERDPRFPQRLFEARRHAGS